jgi:hypothetical protein
VTAKDYRAIAAILAGDLATSTNEETRLKVRAIALSLADYFARNNARFNRQQFYETVGI